MNLKEIEELKTEIGELVYEITGILEENRHYPSVREAGTTPNDDAYAQAEDLVRSFLVKHSGKEIKQEDFRGLDSFDKVIAELQELGKEGDCALFNFVDSCDVFTEVDTQKDDRGFEGKYIWYTNVYKHEPTGKFIGIVNQYTGGRDREWLSLESVDEVTKTEVVTYTWS